MAKTVCLCLLQQFYSQSSFKDIQGKECKPVSYSLCRISPASCYILPLRPNSTIFNWLKRKVLKLPSERNKHLPLPLLPNLGWIWWYRWCNGEQSNSVRKTMCYKWMLLNVKSLARTWNIGGKSIYAILTVCFPYLATLIMLPNCTFTKLKSIPFATLPLSAPGPTKTVSQLQVHYTSTFQMLTITHLKEFNHKDRGLCNPNHHL